MSNTSRQMRVFIADTSVWFLTQLQRLFCDTRVNNECYAATCALDAQRLFRGSPAHQTTCLVQPCDAAVKLTLEQCTSSKYKLICPAPAFHNTRVLMKQILRFVQQQDVHMDVLVFPALGERSALTARAMHGAIVDVLMIKER